MDEDEEAVNKTLYPYYIGKVEEVIVDSYGNQLIGVYYWIRHLFDGEEWWKKNNDGSELTTQQKLLQAREWHWQEMPRLRGVDGHHQYFPNDDYAALCWYKLNSNIRKAESDRKVINKPLEKHAKDSHDKLVAEHAKLKSQSEKEAASAVGKSRIAPTSARGGKAANRKTMDEEASSGRGAKRAAENEPKIAPTKHKGKEANDNEEEVLTSADRLVYLQKNIIDFEPFLCKI